MPYYSQCAPELVYTRDMVRAVAQSASSRTDIFDAIVDISLDDDLLKRASNGAAAKSKLKKATFLNLRNKASIITTVARSFLKKRTTSCKWGQRKI